MSWQFTRWGMKPEEVRAASFQIIEDASEETGIGPEASLESQAGQRALLRSVWASGDFRFKTYFFFDAMNDLRSVKLVLLDSAQSQGLEVALVHKHGTPEAEGHEFFDFLRWRTSSEVITYIGPISDDAPGVVIYVALDLQSSAGL